MPARHARRAHPGADVAVAEAAVERRVLAHQAGLGQDLAPSDKPAGELPVTPRIERLLPVFGMELDGTFVDHGAL